MGGKDRCDGYSDIILKDSEIGDMLSLEDARRLLESARRRQADLEMQNEELKKVQEAIEEGRRRLADLYDCAPVGYLTLNQGVIDEANLTASALLRLPRQQLMGIPFQQYVDPDHNDEYFKHHQNVLESNKRAACELRLRKSDGEAFWARFESVPFGPAGSDLGSVSLYTAIIDISERKRAEEALRESEEKYRALVESVNSVIIRIDNEGRVIFLNDYGRDFFGYSMDELEGKGLVGTVLPSEAAGHLNIKSLLAYMAEHPEEYREKEIENRRRNGERVWVSWTTKTLHDKEGRFAGILAVGNDVTQRKRLEREIRQAQKMEAIGTLAGGIAHDFNNILAAIIGFAEMVEDDLPPESKSVRQIHRVLSAASRGADLVQQILAFSRNTGIARVPLSVSRLARETVRSLRASLPCTVEIELTTRAMRDTVAASPSDIRQIFINLATNASSAMKEKAGTIRIGIANITLESACPIPDADIKPGEYVEITVEDSGCGMSSDTMQHIFEPFFTTKEVGRGTGMGLAVVFGIVKSLDGLIRVESEPGTGSVFRVLLPVPRIHEEPDSSAEAVLPTGTERVLFVDDEELIVEWGRAALERLGYTVTAFLDGAKALDAFSSDPFGFDLIIVDQTMPKLTGLTLSKKFLKIRPDIPIVLCTGHGGVVSPEKVKAAGIREFIVKPLGRHELAEVIRRVLNTPMPGV